MKILITAIAGLLISSTSSAAEGFSHLEALCERVGGEAYFAVWSNEAGFELQYSGDIDLGPSTVEKTNDAITITSERLHDPIVIGKGKTEVEISGGWFFCDY